MTNPLDEIWDKPDPEDKKSILEEDTLFCELGTLLALRLQRTCSYVIENADDNHAIEKFKAALAEACEQLMLHRFECRKCWETTPESGLGRGRPVNLEDDEPGPGESVQ